MSKRGALRVDLDYRAVRVAARRHKGAFERAERKALAVHQFGQHLGDVLRLARRDRYVMDHPKCPLFRVTAPPKLVLAPTASSIPRFEGAEQCAKRNWTAARSARATEVGTTSGLGYDGCGNREGRAR
jgi:hypothetical protein